MPRNTNYRRGEIIIAGCDDDNINAKHFGAWVFHSLDFLDFGA
jgi:hypothetical protein